MRDKTEEQRTYLFLHGYAENAEVFYNRVSKVFAPKHRSLFFNGIFPIPTIRKDIVLYQYAWYFFNPIEKKYFIDFSTPVNCLKKAIQGQVEPTDKITIIGYSQGGYLAPFLAQELSQVDHVIAINASMREDLLGDRLNFRFDQIHGKQDDIVDYDLARARFEKLKAKINQSHWHAVESADHKLSPSILKTLEKTL